mgnify:CR=1 FL=1
MNFAALKRRLMRLIENNRSGAGALENRLSDIFISGASGLSRREFRSLVELSLSWQPPMANILNLISFARRKLDSDYSNLPRLLENRLMAIEKERQRLYRLAGRRIAFCKTIATISHSTAVEESVRAAVEFGWRGKMLIPESRPAMEGRALAARLSRFPIKVEFGVDTLILSRLEEAEAAFVGADLVTKTHFVNKIGTSLLVRLLPPGKPLFVLADSSKFWRKRIPRIPSMPSAEIWNAGVEKVNILNRYFEIMPLSNRIRIICPKQSAPSFE